MAIRDIFRRNNKQEELTKEERSFLFPSAQYYAGSSIGSNSTAMAISAFYCGVNQISNSVSVLPMNIIEYDGKIKKQVKHNLYNVLNVKPEEKFNHANFMKLLVEAMLVDGNGYAYIERDEQLNVNGLKLINPKFVQPIVKEDGSVIYIVAGAKAPVPASDMIHLYQHLDEMHNGIGVIRYAARSLNTINDAEKHAGNVFRAGGTVSGVIKSSSPLNEAQKQQIATSWSAAFSGKRDAVGVAILPQGLDYQSVSLSNQDLDLINHLRFSIEEIARWLCIPPMKLMVYENSSYNSLEMMEQMYLKDCIYPIAQIIEDEFSRKLFKPSQVGKYYVDFNYDVLLETDKKSQAEFYRQMVLNGILSINEIRGKLGFEPVEGEGGDCHFIQLSYGNTDAIARGDYVKQNAQDQQGYTKVDNKVKEGDEEQEKDGSAEENTKENNKE